jgi:hypothetical protein
MPAAPSASPATAALADPLTEMAPPIRSVRPSDRRHVAPARGCRQPMRLVSFVDPFSRFTNTWPSDGPPAGKWGSREGTSSGGWEGAHGRPVGVAERGLPLPPVRQFPGGSPYRAKPPEPADEHGTHDRERRQSAVVGISSVPRPGDEEYGPRASPQVSGTPSENASLLASRNPTVRPARSRGGRGAAGAGPGA